MTAPTTDPAAAVDQAPVSSTTPTTADAAEVVEQDLLVEDVSIDGMCGVY